MWCKTDWNTKLYKHILPFCLDNVGEGVFIGFTAWKTTPQVLSSGENVIYEELTINEGGHYKPLTGKFLVISHGRINRS